MFSLLETFTLALKIPKHPGQKATGQSKHLFSSCLLPGFNFAAHAHENGSCHAVEPAQRLQVEHAILKQSLSRVSGLLAAHILVAYLTNFITAKALLGSLPAWAAFVSGNRKEE